MYVYYCTYIHMCTYIHVHHLTFYCTMVFARWRWLWKSFRHHFLVSVFSTPPTQSWLWALRLFTFYTVCWWRSPPPPSCHAARTGCKHLKTCCKARASSPTDRCNAFRKRFASVQRCQLGTMLQPWPPTPVPAGNGPPPRPTWAKHCRWVLTSRHPVFRGTWCVAARVPGKGSRRGWLHHRRRRFIVLAHQKK